MIRISRVTMGRDRRFGLCQVYPDPKEHEATAEKKVE
jgi:hypothetical protein